jgi:hypothetical protein
VVIRFSATRREADPNAVADSIWATHCVAIPTSAVDHSAVVGHSVDLISAPLIQVLIAAPIVVDCAVQTGVPSAVPTAVVPSVADPSGVGVRTR